MTATSATPETKPISRSRESRRRLDPEQAAAMGKRSSPAKREAAIRNAVLSPRHAGHTHTPEAKARIGKSLVGNPSRTGKPHSPETIEKIRAGNLATAARRKAEKAKGNNGSSND